MGPLGRAWFRKQHQKRLEAAAAALNTEELLSLLDGAVHPKQRHFVHDDSKRIAALVGARGGKSTGGRARFLRCMLRIKRARCLFVAPTVGQAKKIIWEPFKEMLNRLGIEFESNETDYIIKLKHNGSTLMLGGAATKADVDRFRGLAFHEIGIDECSSFRSGLLEWLVDRVLAPRLGDYRGALWLISTPGHRQRGLFYEVTRIGSDRGTPFEEGREDVPRGYSTHHWSLQDGAPYVQALANAWAEALITKSDNDWDDDNPIWRREYLGFWAADDTEMVFKYRPHTDDGLPWNQWDPKKDANGIAILPDHLKGETVFYSYGVDPGIRDPFGLVIFAWCPHDPTKTLYHVYEFAKKGMYAELIRDLMLGKDGSIEKPKGLIGATGWPSVKVADQQNNLALFLELSEVHNLYFKEAKKRDKHAKTELFNGDLLAGRIKVMKGSQLEVQLQDLEWDVDDHGGIHEDTAARNDLADAALYARFEADHLLSSPAPPKAPYFPPNSDTPDDDSGPEPASIEETLLFDDDPYGLSY